jgi:hypothetical protein
MLLVERALLELTTQRSRGQRTYRYMSEALQLLGLLTRPQGYGDSRLCHLWHPGVC